MKKKSTNFERIFRSVGFFLIVTLLLAGCGKDNGAIEYEFLGENEDAAGYAQGCITFSGKKPGIYGLYWSDDTGALADYYEITQIEITDEIKVGSITLEENTAIVPGATKVIAVSEEYEEKTVKNAAALYEIPKEKQSKYQNEDALYTFNSYSDIHIDEEKWGEVPAYWWMYSEQHWADALDYATKMNVDFIISSGDQITNAKQKNTAKEWKAYEYILAASDYVNPIYESSGNHEVRQAGMVEEGLYDFIIATGLDSKSKTIKEEKPYYAITEEKTGDLFIFMALEGGYKPAKNDEFSDEQLDWVEGLLKENYGTKINIYLIQHANISGYGPGDDAEEPYYEGSMNPELPSAQRFINILNTYKDIIWISGHTHETYALGYNYTNNQGTSCHMIHNSSVGNPTHIEDGELDYTFHAELSQGYYVQVFEDAIIFNGANLCDEKIYPLYTYVIEGSTQKRNETEKTYRTDWSVTIDKIRSIQANAKSCLGVYYEFSSYNSYQNLKKAYYQYKDADIENMTDEELSVIYDALGKGIKSLCEQAESINQFAGR